jgi:hypothetical protein
MLLQLDLMVQETIKHAKEEIWNKLQIPQTCQTLLLDGTVLQDSDNPASLCGDVDSLLSVTLVVSPHAAYEALESGSLQMRVKALRDIGYLGLKGGDAGVIAVVTSLKAHLQDSSRPVTETAIEVLSQLALKGDTSTRDDIVCALARMALKTVDSRAREVALQALKRASKNPDMSAAIRAVINDSIYERSCRQAAQALVQMLEARDCVPEAIAECLKNSKDSIKHATVHVLAHLPRTCKDRCHSAVIQCGYSSDWAVRWAAVKALGEVAEKGDECTIKALTYHLRDCVGHVRMAALKALVHIAKAGDEICIGALVESLEETDTIVKEGAMELLASMPNTSNERLTLATNSNSMIVDPLDNNASRKSCPTIAQRT